MAILVISISLDSSDENVGSSIPSRIILFGTIPAEIPAETPTIPLVVPTLPHTSPFLYTDSSNSDTSERPPSQDPYKDIVAQWRSRVVVHSSPLSSPTHDSPPTDVSLPTLRHILPAPPGLPRRPAVLVLPGSLSGHSLPDSFVDAPATISAGPSRKRYRSPAVSVPLSTTADMDTDTARLFEMASAREANVGVEDGIGSDVKEEAEEEAESRDRGTIKIGVDKVSDIKVLRDRA
ncbi:hypothetical protein Tco_1148218 [Tanacetum coccineum]